jgi:hypothetical protein
MPKALASVSLPLQPDLMDHTLGPLPSFGSASLAENNLEEAMLDI